MTKEVLRACILLVVEGLLELCILQNIYGERVFKY